MEPDRNKKIILSQHAFEQLCVCAWRYGVTRKMVLTEYDTVGQLIAEHLEDIHSEFLRQLIDEIYYQQRWYDVDREEAAKEKENVWYRLKVHSEDYVRLLKQCKEKGKLDGVGVHILKQLEDILKMIPFSHLDEQLKNPYRKEENADHLNWMLELVQAERMKRGYRRIEKDW